MDFLGAPHRPGLVGHVGRLGSTQVRGFVLSTLGVGRPEFGFGIDGRKNAMPRLTPEQALRLEAEYRGTRLSRRALARRYQVDERTVRNHVRGLPRDLVVVVNEQSGKLVARPDPETPHHAGAESAFQMTSDPAGLLNGHCDRAEAEGAEKPAGRRPGKSHDPMRDEILEAATTIAETRASLTIAQMRRLRRHDHLLDRVEDLLGDYLSDDPVRRGVAREVLFPTEKDSLSSILRTLGVSRAQITELERKVLGIERKNEGNLPPKPLTSRVDLRRLSTGQLGQVHQAIQVLRNAGLSSGGNPLQDTGSAEDRFPTGTDDRF